MCKATHHDVWPSPSLSAVRYSVVRNTKVWVCLLFVCLSLSVPVVTNLAVPAGHVRRDRTRDLTADGGRYQLLAPFNVRTCGTGWVDKRKVGKKEKKKKITIYDYHWHFHLTTPKYDFMIAGRQSSNWIVSSKDIFIVISRVWNIRQYFRGGGVPILLICYSIPIESFLKNWILDKVILKTFWWPSLTIRCPFNFALRLSKQNTPL